MTYFLNFLLVTHGHVYRWPWVTLFLFIIYRKPCVPCVIFSASKFKSYLHFQYLVPPLMRRLEHGYEESSFCFLTYFLNFLLITQFMSPSSNDACIIFLLQITCCQGYQCNEDGFRQIEQQNNKVKRSLFSHTTTKFTLNSCLILLASVCSLIYLLHTRTE